MPAGFADDVDDVGLTSEIDPQVGTNTVNYVPRWDGSALVTGTIFDNGNIGIGTETPGLGLRLEVNGSAKIDHSFYVVDSLGIGTESPVAKLDIMRSGPGTQLLSLRDLLGGSFGIDLQGVGLSSRAAFKRSSGGAPLIEVMSIPLDGPNAGNVGIGTITPGAKLEVVGGAADAGLIINREGGQLKLSGGAYHGGLWTSGGNLYLGNWDTGAGVALNLGNGNVGIGTPAPAYKLDVNGDTIVRGTLGISGGDYRIQPDWKYLTYQPYLALVAYQPGEISGVCSVLIPPMGGFVVTDYQNNRPNMWVSGDGANMKIAGSYGFFSDDRIKFNEQRLDYGLAQVMALEPKRYDRADWEIDPTTEEIIIHPEKVTNEIGLVAQDVQKVIPEAVDVPEDENRQLWSISYDTLVPVLVKAIQEQQAQIESLKQRVEMLEQR